jgi:hypothetical protein
MEKVDQYRRYARQAIGAAREATAKNEKNDLLEIAETWLQLANSTSTSAKSNYSTLQ